MFLWFFISPHFHASKSYWCFFFMLLLKAMNFAEIIHSFSMYSAIFLVHVFKHTGVMGTCHIRLSKSLEIWIEVKSPNQLIQCIEIKLELCFKPKMICVKSHKNSHTKIIVWKIDTSNLIGGIFKFHFQWPINFINWCWYSWFRFYLCKCYAP